MTQRWYPLRLRRKLSACAFSLETELGKDLSVAFTVQYYTPLPTICQEVILILILARAAGIDEVTPIKVSAVKRDDKSLGGTDIGSDGDIIHIAKAKQLV